MAYHELDVPEAKSDLSPMAVAVRTTGKRWYDFVTSICAIVGGCVEIKIYGAFVLNHRVVAIDATPVGVAMRFLAAEPGRRVIAEK